MKVTAISQLRKSGGMRMMENIDYFYSETLMESFSFRLKMTSKTRKFQVRLTISGGSTRTEYIVRKGSYRDEASIAQIEPIWVHSSSERGP